MQKVLEHSVQGPKKKKAHCIIQLPLRHRVVTQHSDSKSGLIKISQGFYKNTGALGLPKAPGEM